MNIGVLDFSRAIDTVPHARLLGKLQHYGINGPILHVDPVFSLPQIRVVVDGETTSTARVDSGVPQGTVMGPLSLKKHLPEQVSPGTITRLFADDCLVYREINLVDDQVILQRDLTALVNWTKT